MTGKGKGNRNGSASSAPASAGAKKKGAGPKPKRGGKKNGLVPHAVPAAMGAVYECLEPKITRGKNSTRIAHRELIEGFLQGSPNFQITKKYAVNPGLAATFPWLSQQATSWESYRVHKMEFQYISSAGTGTRGTVYISPSYDATDPPPTSEIELANNVGAKSDNVWGSFDCALNPAAMMALGPRRFTRRNAVAGDRKTFDVANVFVGTVGAVDDEVIGKLWVEYDIEFFTPQSDPQTGSKPSTVSHYSNFDSSQILATTVETILINQTAVYNPLDITVTGAGAFVPPAGCYRVDWVLTLQNSVNEATSLLFRVAKNAAPLTDYQRADHILPAGGAMTLSGHDVFIVNGTDEITLLATAFGATGVLTLPAAMLNSVSFTVI